MTKRNLYRVLIIRVALGISSLIVALSSLIGYAISYKPLYAPIDRILGNLVPIPSMAPTTAVAITMLSVATILGGIGRANQASREGRK